MSRTSLGLVGIVLATLGMNSSLSTCEPREVLPGGYEFITNHPASVRNNPTNYNNHFRVRSVSLVYSGWGPPVDTAYEVEILAPVSPNEVVIFLKQHGIYEEATAETLRNVTVGTKLKYVNHFFPRHPIYSI